MPNPMLYAHEKPDSETRVVLKRYRANAKLQSRLNPNQISQKELPLS